ncbi:MAG: thioredoxin family protein [Planctomycetes bacterium]|nr:thioredoxin family protein [Planctomycetota bacterium]
MDEMTGQDGGLPPARRSRWGSFLLIGLLLALFFFATRPVPPPPGWGTDYAAAVAEAAGANKKLVIAFHMPGCPPCAVMDRTTLKSEAVAQALDSYVPVRVDVSKEITLANRFGVFATPVYAIVDSQGRLLSRCEGAQSVESFVRFLVEAKNAPAADPTVHADLPLNP